MLTLSIRKLMDFRFIGNFISFNLNKLYLSGYFLREYFVVRFSLVLGHIPDHSTERLTPLEWLGCNFVPFTFTRYKSFDEFP